MLSIRSDEKEQMDNLQLSGEDLNKTLIGLSSINKYLGNTKSIFKAVKKEICKTSRPLIIVDLGCGGGDNLKAIANWCQANNKSAELIGIDGNVHILDYANKQNNTNIKIQYLQADILDDKFELPMCDILISSHFIYHFFDNQLVNFIINSKKRVSTKMIFSELQRSSLAYVLFKITSIFLPFSSIVKQDGLLAIKRAFTRKELERILTDAQCDGFTIHRKWVFRFLVSIPV